MVKRVSILLLLAGVASPANYFAGDANCVSVYDFESGALTTDGQGNNTLVKQGTGDITADAVTYKVGSASAYSASDGYYRVIDALLSSSPEFPTKSTGSDTQMSLCAWVNLDSTTAETIASKWGDDASKKTWLLVVTSGKLRLGIGYNGGASEEYIASNIDVWQDRWTHVALTYNITTQGYHFRVTDDDGEVNDVSGSSTNAMTFDDDDFRLFMMQTYSWPFTGNMDEVAVFNDILASAEIDEIVLGTYGDAPVPPGPGPRYVDPDTGSNDANGASAATPWQTIEYAEANTDNGYTVYLMDGNYPAVTINRAGNSSRASWNDAITFVAYPGDSPVIPQMTITGDYDRYLIFQGTGGLEVNYPDSNQAIGTVDVLYIPSGGMLKFLNLPIHGALQRDAAGEYCDPNSTTNGVTLGTYSEPNVGYVLFDNCDIGYTAQMGIDNQGPRRDQVIVQDCTIHDCGASGILHDRDDDDDSGGDCIYQRNSIYRQVHVWTSAGKTGYHHGSGIHITGDDCQWLANRVWLWGSSAGIRAYQGAVSGGYDGGVEINGAYDSQDHQFDAGEAVTQAVSGAQGKFLRQTGSPATMIEISRATDGTTFDASNNIVSDSNASRIWVPTSIGNTRKWGGRTNVILENNLLYWGANTYYKMELHELVPNSRVVNNTIIGSHVAATGYNYLWYSLLNYDSYYFTGDPNGFVIANNLFVGNVGGIPSGCTYVGNIAFGMDGVTQAQLDVSHPGNEVWCSSPSVATDLTNFTTSGVTFVGAPDMETYGFEMPADVNDGFDVAGAPVGVNNWFALVSDGNAVDTGSTTYYATTDILGRSRGAAPDIGAYEYMTTPAAGGASHGRTARSGGHQDREGGHQQ